MTTVKAKLRHTQAGFTVLELVAVLVVIGILIALVTSTYASIQRDQRNQTRKHDIQDIYEELESYYVENNSRYPTLANMNDSGWVKTNLKTLNRDALRDPSSQSYKLAAKPAAGVFAYTVTGSSGAVCDNVQTICAHYTLTATYENSPEKTFVISSLN